MNAMQYVVNSIKNIIPNEVLSAAMNIDETPMTVNLSSLDDKIIRKILKGVVLIDANVLAGVEMIIPLINITPSYYEDFYTVYTIPPELTNNREILSALNLSFLPASGYYGTMGYASPSSTGFQAYNNGGFTNFNPIMGAADRIGNAASSGGVLGHTHLELVSYNTVLVYAHYRTIANFGLRVVVENESNMNNIQPRSYNDLSKLCILGAKAYIHNKLIVPVNSGMIHSGQDLGIFKSIVEGYSSSYEDYDTFLKEVWCAVAWMNDTTRYNRFLASMLPVNI